jgi:hypothetical protein
MSRPAILERMLADEVSMHASPSDVAQLRAYIEGLERDAATHEALRDATSKLVEGFNHVSGIARLWEPDHSSGRDRALWARATEACADVAKMLDAAQGQGDGRASEAAEGKT